MLYHFSHFVSGVVLMSVRCSDAKPFQLCLIVCDACSIAAQIDLECACLLAFFFFLSFRQRVFVKQFVILNLHFRTLAPSHSTRYDAVARSSIVSARKNKKGRKRGDFRTKSFYRTFSPQLIRPKQCFPIINSSSFAPSRLT
jgi:hypothetical protein